MGLRSVVDLVVTQLVLIQNASRTFVIDFIFYVNICA
jgi:hypothetical protein